MQNKIASNNMLHRILNCKIIWGPFIAFQCIFSLLLLTILKRSENNYKDVETLSSLEKCKFKKEKDMLKFSEQNTSKCSLFFAKKISSCLCGESICKKTKNKSMEVCFKNQLSFETSSTAVADCPINYDYAIIPGS